MRGPRHFSILLILLLLAEPPPAHGEDEKPSILPHSALDVAPTRPRPAAQYRHIEALVSRLAALDEWRTGLDPNSGGGRGFAPQGDDGNLIAIGIVKRPGADETGAVTPGPTKADPAPALAREAFATLVAYGAEAIPALLAHLDDDTPTRLVFGQGGGFGSTWTDSEIDANPALAGELAAIRSAFPGGWPADPARGDELDRDMEKPYVQRHTITIGDCCFVLLGQITNRVYETLGYRPTCCHVVNSPVRDPRIARAVRKQWEGKDPRLELARRLMADLHTTNPGNTWYWEGEGQIGAAQRLAYYLPRASEAVLVALVDGIEAKGASGSDDARLDEDDLLDVLVPSDREPLRAAFRRLALRTKQPRVFAALIPGIEDMPDAVIFERLHEMIERTLCDRSRWPRNRFLREIGRRQPEKLVAILTDRMGGSLAHARAAALFAYRHGLVLPIRGWRPMLDAKLPVVFGKTISGKRPLERLRLCDVAAIMIVRQRRDLAFDEPAEEAQRDAQILLIRKTLDAEDGK